MWNKALYKVKFKEHHKFIDRSSVYAICDVLCTVFSLSITPAILIGVFITLIISCLFPFIVKYEANNEGTWW